MRRVRQGGVRMAEKAEVAKIEGEQETVSVELPAPAGWKKFIPKKHGPPRRYDVVFISPTGEKIRSRKNLARFLRSHPGGPSPSEFDWKHGDTPRRSARISAKAKETESPEDEPPKKRERKSDSRKGKQKGNAGDTEEEEVDVAPESEKTARQAVESIVDTEMKDGEDTSVKGPAEATVPPEEGPPKKRERKSDSNTEMKDGEDTSVKGQAEATVPPEEGPPKKRERKSDSNKGKQKMNGGDSEEEVDDAPESDKTSKQAVESIADAELKDGEDGSVKGQAEAAAKSVAEDISSEPDAKDMTIEEMEVKSEDADKDSAGREERKDNNELEKLEVEEASKDVPVLYAREETKEENSAVGENQEKLGVEELSKDVPVLSAPKETEENSAVRENQDKIGVEEARKDVPVSSVAEATEEKNSSVIENQVDSEVSSLEAEHNKEDFREEEVKDRILFNDNHKCEQKVSSS